MKWVYCLIDLKLTLPVLRYVIHLMLSSNFQSAGIFYSLRLDVVVKGWIGQGGENQVRVSMGTKNKREILTYKKKWNLLCTQNDYKILRKFHFEHIKWTVYKMVWNATSLISSVFLLLYFEWLWLGFLIVCQVQKSHFTLNSCTSQVAYQFQTNSLDHDAGHNSLNYACFER